MFNIFSPAEQKAQAEFQSRWRRKTQSSRWCRKPVHVHDDDDVHDQDDIDDDNDDDDDDEEEEEAKDKLPSSCRTGPGS